MNAPVERPATMPDTLPVISVVIPCYNCARTLPETLASLRAQRVSVPLELILVDDGSTDGTGLLLQELRAAEPTAVVLSHEKNRGGGAARNTGIARARGRYILCFDSDDLLHEGALETMYRRLEESDLDGVTFAGSFSFKDRPTTTRFQEFSPAEDVVKLCNVFDGTRWPVGANFMYRKRVHETVGGYLENNNFDTQGFGIRFLAHGLRASAATGAFFYQRQFGREESYFERAYTSGEYSVGFFLIIEHIFSLLSPVSREAYLGFPILTRSNFSSNLMGRLHDVYCARPESFFAYGKLSDVPSSVVAGHPWETVLSGLAQKDWPGAAAAVIDARTSGVHPEILGFMLQRILGLATSPGDRASASETALVGHALRPHDRNELREQIARRVLRKMRSLFTCRRAEGAGGDDG